MQPKANTPVETSQPSVALVSHQSSLQTSLLAHLISHELNIECPIVELSTFAQLNTTFALVDCQHHRREDLAKWLHDCQDCDDAPIIALFNVTPHSEHEDLLAWPCVHGLFPHHEQPRTTATGLKPIAKWRVLASSPTTAPLFAEPPPPGLQPHCGKADQARATNSHLDSRRGYQRQYRQHVIC